MENKTQVVIFGGGCFWCTEAVFKMLKGVVSVTPGYAGGTLPDPSYEKVSRGKSGHAEVVRIEYDPALLSFKELLTVFFATHDPTTPNRQGADVGAEYRSIILYTTPEQKATAEGFIAEINASNPSGSPVVTEVQPLDAFYEAEEYHKDYYARNAGNGYCQVVINQKLKKVQKEFAQLLKEQSL